MPHHDLKEQYLSLLKKSLLNQLYMELEAQVHLLISKIQAPLQLPQLIQEFLNIEISDVYQVLEKTRKTGSWIPYHTQSNGAVQELTEFRNFTFMAHSMIGQARMDQLHSCLNKVLKDGVKGDLIETGVWKGGATVFMRGFLQAHGIQDRCVWVADSFEGVPPNTDPHDRALGIDFSAANFPYLSVSEEKVRSLFERYDLLDKQVRFLKGWFKDTLPGAPIKKLAVLRLDGDLYESTMDALNALYHKVSPGGFVIVDDYKAVESCQVAIDEFRATHKIKAKLHPIDGVSVYWRVPSRA